MLAGLGLAWTALADPITVFVVVIPLALVCAIRVFQGVVLHKERLRSLYPRLLWSCRLRRRWPREARLPRQSL